MKKFIRYGYRLNNKNETINDSLKYHYFFEAIGCSRLFKTEAQVLKQIKKHSKNLKVKIFKIVVEEID